MPKSRKPGAVLISGPEEAAWQRALEYGRQKRTELFADLSDDELDEKIVAIVQQYRHGRREER